MTSLETFYAFDMGRSLFSLFQVLANWLFSTFHCDARLFSPHHGQLVFAI